MANIASDFALLSNASATGSAQEWPGGAGIMEVVGTFNGATVALQVLGPDGSTYIAGGPVATVAGSYPFNLPPGFIKGVITGSPTGIYARVAATEGGLAASATGVSGGSDTSGRAVVVGAAAHDAAVSGNPVRAAGRARTPGTAYTPVAADDTADLTTDLVGNQNVRFPAGAGTDRSVNVTTASGTVMAANTSRLKAILANDNTVPITVKLGSTAVAGAGLTQKVLLPGDYWEIDFYTGIITAIHADTGNKPLFAWEV
jgi:hypothetical protein